jgi:hypothetical protein
MDVDIGRASGAELPEITVGSGVEAVKGEFCELRLAWFLGLPRLERFRDVAKCNFRKPISFFFFFFF